MATAEVGGPSTGRPVKGAEPRLDSQHLTARKIRVRPRRGTEQRIRTRRRNRSPAEHALQLAQARLPARLRFPTKPDTPRSSEPILVPKLRIKFADFPYLHYSID